jgi:uncharacterized protein YndB with AHSA1/START domain
MTRQDFSNEHTTMYAEAETLLIERTFAAPIDLVWAAMTEAEHLANWIGPRETTTTVTEWDFRVGGTWRWVNAFDGGEVAFHGTFREIESPQRMVRTEVMEGGDPSAEQHPAIETIVCTETGGKTTVSWTTRFPAQEVLDMAIESGMAYGALAQMDRLADLLAKVRPS